MGFRECLNVVIGKQKSTCRRTDNSERRRSLYDGPVVSGEIWRIKTTGMNVLFCLTMANDNVKFICT